MASLGGSMGGRLDLPLIHPPRVSLGWREPWEESMVETPRTYSPAGPGGRGMENKGTLLI